MRRRAAGFPSGKTLASWRESESAIPLPTQRALATLEWLGRARTSPCAVPAGPARPTISRVSPPRRSRVAGGWPGSASSRSPRRSGGPRSTARPAGSWPASVGATSSSSTTSGCSPPAPRPPRPSTGWSTPPTSGAAWPSRPTSTPRASTPSCPRPSPPHRRPAPPPRPRRPHRGRLLPARRGDRGKGGGAARLTTTGDLLSAGVEITCPRRGRSGVRPGGSRGRTGGLGASVEWDVSALHALRGSRPGGACWPFTPLSAVVSASRYVRYTGTWMRGKARSG